MLSALEYDDHELSILFTDDEAVRELNSAYRGIDKATNVLAFPMMEGEFAEVTPGLLGDIAISVDTAVREAQEAGITLNERMSQLLIHGILHLVGYDHESGENDALAMESKSLELMKLIEKNQSLDAF
ncbi:MAG: rRNA maturation RNase YbeY [Pseudomonadota bacterium]